MTAATDLKEFIDRRLEELIPSSPEPIYSAARYSLLNGGKRIRPLLALAVAASFDADLSNAIDPACALEMIHTYSLIHDDLPCMDDDDLRRGKPTLHKVYGEGMALLAGDYLLTYAFEVIAKAQALSDTQKIALVQILAMRAGSSGMIGGQATDIESQGKKLTEETLIQMHLGKTGALLAACFEFGAIIAGKAPSPLLQSLAEELGLAYQFQDDLLNATATTAQLGKTAGSDAAKEKPTAISIFGQQGTEKRLERLQTSIFEKLDKLSLCGDELPDLIKKILQRSF